MIVLDPEQEEAVERMVNEPTKAALNASQYGTGKTVVTVEVALRLEAKIILIVAPLFTKYGWESTILGQHPEANVRFINSRKAGQEALADLLNGVGGWYIIGREYLASKTVRERVAKFSPQIDFFAYDECQKWANRKSQGFKMMKTMKPKYRMALSATPARNKFDGLYAISFWLWPEYVKAQTGVGYWNWVKRWAAVEDDFYAGVIITGEKKPGEYVTQLPCYVRLEKDFGEPYEEIIEVDLSAKERSIYDKFEKHLIVWLQENVLVAKFPIVKRIRLRQMTLGEVAVDPETEVVYFADDMKSTKYDTLLEYINANPDEAMLIFTDSAKFANVVAYRLIRDGHKALPWTGEVPEDVRHAMKDSFVNGELDFLVATVGSIGEGVDGLQHRARTMVWLSKADDNMMNMQAFRRLYRRGQERRVKSIEIVARNTYDSGQLSKLVQNQLDMNATLKKERG